MTLEGVTEGFVRSFCRMKSKTHPYLAENNRGIWVMRDAPGTKKPRKIEIVTLFDDPEKSVKAVRDLSLGWHFLVDIKPIGSDLGSVRHAYKELGYRALSTEWMFVHEHVSIPTFDSEPLVRLVESIDELRKVKQSARQPRTLIEGTRLYGIWDDLRDYGWVRSVPQDDYGWAYALHVHEEFRKHGYGRALMSRLLRDDQIAGLKGSALIASSAGARLYPHLGYQQLGTLQIFCPRTRQ